MSEHIIWNSSQSLTEQQGVLLKQLEVVLEAEEDLIANAANFCSMLQEIMGNFWTGFYFVDQDKNNLVLGPFQGPLACTRIAYGKGVCGLAWKEKQTLIVPDVEHFPGHIACSSASRSELVIPVYDTNNELVAVLDLDSDELDYYSKERVDFAEKALKIFSRTSL